MHLTGSEIIVKTLVDQGADTIFGYPGGAVLPIYDAIFRQNELRHILVRHEQAAVHAAEGYARSTGKVGVVLVTSGPGATNAVTGLTDALMDSIPIVCLTGQVPTHLIGNDAFQEADTVGITRPCTKHNYLVKDIDALAKSIAEAFYVANSGRPGPVVVDLPKDIQNSTTKYERIGEISRQSYQPVVKAEQKLVNSAVSLLEGAERPMVYSGGGVINSGSKATKLLIELAKLTGFPVTNTLMGLGGYPGNDEQFLGMLGMHGTYEANMAMHECDVMLAVGARFDDRVTGKLQDFAPHAQIVQIDIDKSSINKNVPVDIALLGDAAMVLGALIKTWKKTGCKARQDSVRRWWEQINAWRALDCLRYDNSSTTIKPQYAIQRLHAHTKDRDVYFTTEVGQHQMKNRHHGLSMGM